MENFKEEKVEMSNVSMVWMFVSPQNSYVEILIPKKMVLGGGGLGGG